MTDEEQIEVEQISKVWISMPFLEKFKRIGTEYFKKIIKEKENGFNKTQGTVSSK